MAMAMAPKWVNLGIEEDPQNGMALISHVESSKLLQYCKYSPQEKRIPAIQAWEDRFQCQLKSIKRNY